MPSNPNIIRVGDNVRVVIPKFFIRVGYPKTFHEEKKRFEEEYADQILAFAREMSSRKAGQLSLFPEIAGSKPKTQKVGMGLDTLALFGGATGREMVVVSKIAGALGYLALHNQGFGGSKRELYTVEVPNKSGVTARVEEIKFVKTGQYVNGSWSSHDYYGGQEYEPAQLVDQKTHKILTLDLYKDQFFSLAPLKEAWELRLLRIEDCHVQKL